MGLFNKLFGKKTEAASSIEPSRAAQGGAAIAPVLAPALKAYQAGRLDAAIAAASPYVDTYADASRLCALAHSDAHRYGEAFPYWLALFQQEPSAHNALQLATTSVMCGEVPRGEAWLMKFDEINEERHELSPVTARTQFISALTQSGHLAEALPYLVWVRDVYAHLRITDSHFLYMRGVPFFSAFLEVSLPTVRASLSADAVVAWYEALAGKLDEDGEAQLAAWIGHLKENVI